MSSRSFVELDDERFQYTQGFSSHELIPSLHPTRIRPMSTPDSTPFSDAPFALKGLWNKFTLRGIVECARLVGGEAKIESKKGGGTRITIEVPLVKKGSARHAAN